MIVVMKPLSPQKQVEHVIQLVREMGLKDHIIVGEERTVIAVIGDDRFKDRSVLESAPGVDKVVPILAPYKMASREIKDERTVVPLGGAAGGKIGGTKIGVIAGPCSVESKTQLLEVAHAVKEAGAVGLRGGAFKPRTNPYSFQGLAEKGLELLALAREQTGLAVVTEVMSIDQVAVVNKYADVLQVGARNMQNFNLLNAVGEQSKPVLLKRGMSATLEEFLLAAEYIMSKGNTQVMFCERGIRTYEEYVRNTLALAAVPELHRVTHLPVIVDPSQGTGKSYLVDSMCRAAVAAGADGLIIEVHNDPEHAMTDGAQSITPTQFTEMMRAIARIAPAVDREV
ncbi:MAG TPA: 3-deoxy-7-phosphoheptulonate synthase [Tepidisphaeraceae bacterium]|jgi:3-deoxy-7-phosphoheptulonate synthase|nr:3-deoxy-7-phosphoheptulonate synthase [Tepidisphaeraceae bacterium]